MTFNTESWRERLVKTLRFLEATQRPYLERHWQTNGYPTKVSYNGQDETPYPSSDLLNLYDSALIASRKEEAAYFAKLRIAFDPVRGVLRSHPALGRALGHIAGNDKFMVETANGASMTWLSMLIVGLMKHSNEMAKQGFEVAVAELSALLDASMRSSAVDIPNDLDLGYDLILFFGPQLEKRIEIQPDLIAMPFSELRDWVDADWIRDFVPEHVDRRDLRQIGAIVCPFRWQTRLRRINQSDGGAMRTRSSFEGDALSFLELLAISNQTPTIPFVLINDCIHRVAMELLGKIWTSGGTYPIGFVGRKHNPFRNPPKLHKAAIQQALSAFDARDTATYGRLTLVRRRLAEALARDGRFLLDDRILDVSQSIELMCEIKGTGIGKKIQSSMASLLASDEEHDAAIRKAIKHFYDVRSAIVHGPSDSHRQGLMRDREPVFRSGFNLAQQAYFKLLLEK